MEESSEAKKIIKKIKSYFKKKERFKIDLFDERIRNLIQICGLIIFTGCVVYWVYIMFFTPNYGALLYTTYFTIILISFTCILKLESVFLNTITCLTFYGFLNITIALITNTVDFLSAIVGPILHGAIAIFQLFLVFHPKVPISKKYLLWGVLFFFIFMATYDDYHRFNVITGLEEVVPTAFTKAYSFYALLFSSIGIYLYKKRFGIIVD